MPGFIPRTDGKARVNDPPGYQIRYRAGRRTAASSASTSSSYPEDGRRDGVILRYRQANPPRPLDEPERDLVKATRKAYRSFRFGPDRP